MGNSSAPRVVVTVAVLIALAVVGFWALKLVFSLLFYLFVGVLVIGVGWLVVTAMRRDSR